MRKVLLCIVVFFCLFGCSSKSKDRTDEADALGKEIITYMNNGTAEMYKTTHTITTRNDIGDYECKFILTNSFEGISNLKGKGIIYINKNLDLYRIKLEYKDLSNKDIQSLYYPLSVYYLHLMTANSNPIDIGNVDIDKIMLSTDYLYNLYLLKSFDYLTIENGNFTTIMDCMPPISSNNSGSIEVTIEK